MNLLEWGKSKKLMLVDLPVISISTVSLSPRGDFNNLIGVSVMRAEDTKPTTILTAGCIPALVEETSHITGVHAAEYMDTSIITPAAYDRIGELLKGSEMIVGYNVAGYMRPFLNILNIEWPLIADAMQFHSLSSSQVKGTWDMQTPQLMLRAVERATSGRDRSSINDLVHKCLGGYIQDMPSSEEPMLLQERRCYQIRALWRDVIINL